MKENKSSRKQQIATWTLAIVLLTLAGFGAYLFTMQGKIQNEVQELKNSLDQLKEREDTR